MHLQTPRLSAPIPGVVYVLRSERWPGVHKVGRTAWSTHWRAEQLADEKGYRGFAPFTPVFEVQTNDTVAVENAAHRRLDRCRIMLRCGSRELFRASEAACRAAVMEAAAEVEAGRYLAPVWAGGGRTNAVPPSAGRWKYLVLAILAAAFLLLKL